MSHNKLARDAVNARHNVIITFPPALCAKRIKSNVSTTVQYHNIICDIFYDTLYVSIPIFCNFRNVSLENSKAIVIFHLSWLWLFARSRLTCTWPCAVCRFGVETPPPPTIGRRDLLLLGARGPQRQMCAALNVKI